VTVTFARVHVVRRYSPGAGCDIVHTFITEWTVTVEGSKPNIIEFWYGDDDQFGGGAGYFTAHLRTDHRITGVGKTKEMAGKACWEEAKRQGHFGGFVLVQRRKYQPRKPRS